MGSYISLFKPLLLSLLSVPSLHIHRYSLCLSHFSLKDSLSGALSRIWNRIDFISWCFIYSVLLWGFVYLIGVLML